MRLLFNEGNSSEPRGRESFFVCVVSVNFFFFLFLLFGCANLFVCPPQKTSLKLKNLKKAKQKEGAKMMKTV